MLKVDNEESEWLMDCGSKVLVLHEEDGGGDVKRSRGLGDVY